MSTQSFDEAHALLVRGVESRAFPAAVLEVGCRAGVTWRAAAGRLTYDPGSSACEEGTLFDLASLTKVLVTTTLVMRTVDARLLTIDQPVSALIPGWRGNDRADVTVEDLLSHSSGLTPYLPLYVDHRARVDFEATICALPLEYAARSRSMYSDLGFILLGFMLEDVNRAPLAEQWAVVAHELDLPDMTFAPSREWPHGIAPTEVDPWRGRLLVGEVHDENAWVLGGAAGHAGLFGTASGVGVFARAVLGARRGESRLSTTATMRRFTQLGRVPGSSRALGWDTMLPTSSCGRLMSPQAIGHTGFTGTSLWIDPARDAYVVLLTNRVHPSRANNAIIELRRDLHDAIVRNLPLP